MNNVTIENNKMNEQIKMMQQRIEPLRQQIINHKLYKEINDINDLKIFMQYHVYAVWDFMSLLKALQRNLTCVTVPWFPKQNSDTAYLINEIVIGEETDIDMHGTRKSHYELYLDAMNECVANTETVGIFTTKLLNGANMNTAFAEAAVPEEAAAFVQHTFNVINSNKPHVQAATFTFGREDLIPSMFLSIINDMDNNGENISVFKYYLERHIEVDGDHHSLLAMEMTARLCGDNEVFWQEATEAVVQSLQQRIALWDGVYKQVKMAVAEN